ISRFGVLPYASSMDTIGVLGRRVEDLQLLLRVLTGHDPRDAQSLTKERRVRRGTPQQMPAPRCGLVDWFMDRSERETQHHMEEVIAQLSRRGARVCRLGFGGNFVEAAEARRTIVSAEVANVHKLRYQSDPTGYTPALRALIEEGLAI